MDFLGSFLRSVLGAFALGNDSDGFELSGDALMGRVKTSGSKSLGGSMVSATLRALITSIIASCI